MTRDDWIPVGERLPEAEGEYLVWCPTRPVSRCFVELWIGRWVTKGITHWMPLPPPPKDADDAD